MKGKGSWILKHVKCFEKVQSYKQSEREYVSGESFKYLGKQYRLRVQQTDEEETVKYFRGFIYFFVRNIHDFNRKAKLMEAWYREKAQKIFKDSLNRLYPLVQKYIWGGKASS